MTSCCSSFSRCNHSQSVRRGSCAQENKIHRHPVFNNSISLVSRTTKIFWNNNFYQDSKNNLHGAIFTVFTYIYRLVIDKDLRECQNVSVNFPCALSPTDLLIFFYVRFIFFYSYFCVYMDRENTQVWISWK